MRSGAFKLKRLSSFPSNLWQVEQVFLISESASVTSVAKRKLGDKRDAIKPKVRTHVALGNLAKQDNPCDIIKISIACEIRCARSSLLDQFYPSKNFLNFGSEEK